MDIFENTFQSGSFWGLMALTYSMNVAIEVLRVQNSVPLQVHAPRLVQSNLATIFSISTLPVIVWPIVYVALYDGLLAGVVAWVGLQVVGAVATLLLRIRGPLLAIHLLIATVALPFGYYMTVSTAPWLEGSKTTGLPLSQTEEFNDPNSLFPTIAKS